jgi:hypothetical protein
MTEPVDVYWSFRSPYSYLVTPDLLRLRADYLGMPFVLPARPDPIEQDPATMAVAAEQPYIHRLSALGVEAQRRCRPWSCGVSPSSARIASTPCAGDWTNTD